MNGNNIYEDDNKPYAIKTPPRYMEVRFPTVSSAYAFLAQPKKWGLWHKHPEFRADVEYYRCQLPNGAVIVVEEQGTKRNYHLIEPGDTYSIYPDDINTIAEYILTRFTTPYTDDPEGYVKITTSYGMAIDDCKTLAKESRPRNWSRDGGLCYE